MSTEKYDVIVFGATSFVGQILAQYLFDRHGADGDVRWAMAGRSMTKLESVRDALGGDASSIDLIAADADDAKALQAMCESTRVVISTVGPYALFGSTLVGICAQTGTDYCDLTGEVQWIRRMLDAHEETAIANGARIVHCCGFDSIPSDLGVHFLQEQAREEFGQPCSRVKLRVRSMSGAMSGGTVASLMNAVKEAADDPALRKIMANPFAICPDGHASKARQPNVKFAEYDPDFDAWIAPFVMAAINTRVVHRSNALRSDGYGTEFIYDEATLTGRGMKGRMAAMGLASGLGAFIAAAVMSPTRKLLEAFVVPKPGEGPSPEAQERGSYDLRLHGRTDDGQTIRVKVTGDRDPGYGSTAKMLGEAGVCLALDTPKAETPGGFWTPSTVLGDKLIDRLRAHAGLTFERLD